MKFFAAALALAAGASAYSNVTYVTEVVTAYTTYCPEPTTVVYNDHTYTVTEATTLTITDCPCTIKKPVTTISSVVCNTPNCGGGYHNTTGPVPTPDVPAGTAHPPVVTSTPSPQPEVPVTAGAGRAAALSGAGLAALLGVAAFAL